MVPRPGLEGLGLAPVAAAEVLVVQSHARGRRAVRHALRQDHADVCVCVVDEQAGGVHGGQNGGQVGLSRVAGGGTTQHLCIAFPFAVKYSGKDLGTFCII